MQKDSPRILMIISQFYPLLGGAEVQAQLLACGLLKRGMQVFILTREIKGLPRHETIEGIPIYREIKTVDWGFLWGVFYAVSVCVFLFKKRNDYDIIHCHIVQGFHTVVSLLFKYLFSKKLLVKMSSSGETSDFNLLKEVKFGWFLLRCIRHVDAIISVCKKSTEEILKNGFSKDILIEIPNGVDTLKFFKPAQKKRKNHSNIIFVGRLDSYKGVNYLMNGFKDVLSIIKNVTLTIIGNGPDECLLRDMAKDLGIIDNVVFKGRKEDIWSELCDADIFVLPSLSEGMSNVLLEAMSCGLPVVATSVGGNGDLIKDRCNGMLIEPRDSAKLGGALLELVEHEAFANTLGKKARQTVEEHYCMDRVVDEYVALYNRLAS